MQQKNKPARILRPGAETKVGGSPLTTMGFKARDVLWLLLLSKGKEEEEEEEEREVSVNLGELEDGGTGNEFRQSDAMAWEWPSAMCYVPITLKQSMKWKGESSFYVGTRNTQYAEISSAKRLVSFVCLRGPVWMRTKKIAFSCDSALW